MLTITENMVGDVAVLHLSGRITIGLGNVILRDAVRRLLQEGVKKFVLNFSEVGYMDSSGTGELVSAIVATKREGGSMKFCHPTAKIIDLWTINKTLAFYDIEPSVEAAVASLAGRPMCAVCPVFGCHNRLTYYSGQKKTRLSCHKCASLIELSAPPDAGAEAASQLVGVAALFLTSYKPNDVRIVPPSPHTINVERLELFSYKVVEKAWKTVPPPRRVIFDLRDASEITQAGLDPLLRLCDSAGDDRGVVVLGTRSRPGLSIAPQHARLAFDDPEGALAALGDTSGTPPLTVEFAPADQN